MTQKSAASIGISPQFLGEEHNEMSLICCFNPFMLKGFSRNCCRNLLHFLKINSELRVILQNIWRSIFGNDLNKVFSFKYFLNIAFACKIFSKIIWLLLAAVTVCIDWLSCSWESLQIRILKLQIYVITIQIYRFILTLTESTGRYGHIHLLSLFITEWRVYLAQIDQIDRPNWQLFSVSLVF